MLPADVATVRALRLDVAHQIARHAKHLRISQVAAARQLGIPQSTLSKIVNGRILDLSLELLIRVTVLAGLPITLQTGRAPEEAGAFVSESWPAGSRPHASALSDQARDSLTRSERALTPAQRLEAFLEHNQLLAELHTAGRRVETERVHQAQRR